LTLLGQIILTITFEQSAKWNFCTSCSTLLVEVDSDAVGAGGRLFPEDVLNRLISMLPL